jgi:hypothetical protein
MDWEAIGAIAGLIGVGLVIVSLIYVGAQIRQSNKDSKSQSRQSLLDTFGLLGWELAAQPELLTIVASGLTNWSGMSNLDKTRFDNVMGRYLWNLQRGILQSKDGILDAETLDTIGNQMLHAVLMPGGREWYEETSLASPEVRSYLNDRLNRPESLPLPASDAMPYWIALADDK